MIEISSAAIAEVMRLFPHAYASLLQKAMRRYVSVQISLERIKQFDLTTKNDQFWQTEYESADLFNKELSAWLEKLSQAKLEVSEDGALSLLSYKLNTTKKSYFARRAANTPVLKGRKIDREKIRIGGIGEGIEDTVAMEEVEKLYERIGEITKSLDSLQSLVENITNKVTPLINARAKEAKNFEKMKLSLERLVSEHRAYSSRQQIVERLLQILSEAEESARHHTEGRRKVEVGPTQQQRAWIFFPRSANHLVTSRLQQSEPSLARDSKSSYAHSQESVRDRLASYNPSPPKLSIAPTIVGKEKIHRPEDRREDPNNLKIPSPQLRDKISSLSLKRSNFSSSGLDVEEQEEPRSHKSVYFKNELQQKSGEESRLPMSLENINFDSDRVIVNKYELDKVTPKVGVPLVQSSIPHQTEQGRSSSQRRKSIFSPKASRVHPFSPKANEATNKNFLQRIDENVGENFPSNMLASVHKSRENIGVRADGQAEEGRVPSGKLPVDMFWRTAAIGQDTVIGRQMKLFAKEESSDRKKSNELTGSLWKDKPLAEEDYPSFSDKSKSAGQFSCYTDREGKTTKQPVKDKVSTEKNTKPRSKPPSPQLPNRSLSPKLNAKEKKKDMTRIDLSLRGGGPTQLSKGPSGKRRRRAQMVGVTVRLFEDNFSEGSKY